MVYDHDHGFQQFSFSVSSFPMTPPTLLEVVINNIPFDAESIVGKLETLPQIKETMLMMADGI